ncbi:MAG: methyltransferase domain-containing protein [Deltaproteobacteria bacterium]|nr:methyltransferase domain-containing protein [Deltaproteobacteria bacterium]MBK8239773.1 methyltransferase domain-containing protein [Deltaproteobacteria bacterium]MBK8714506.1 methyltransferase domain-containing protein [Deltaproteobacteria bacterium]MBP7288263.1 methyltransferase domain-containing protein [Nannocystaceae bacterium]
MPDSPESWIARLRCPRCGGGIADAETLRCDTCGIGHPRVGGIPVMLPDARARLDEWRFALAEFRATMNDTRARIVVDLATKPVQDASRPRLERLAGALERHRDLVTGLFEAAGITPAKRSTPAPAAVPGEGSVTSYFHQVHRDWGWDADGSQENQRAAEVLTSMVDAPLGRTLVIGAGAGRLARDLHAGADGRDTFAIDINPLPLLVAARVLTGERVRLLELPIAPPDLAHVCVERELAAPGPTPPGFVLLFADAFAPPFADGSFDTVVTPWFIDEVPRDMTTFLPTIHRLLAPDGRWINHGPLIYHPNHTELPARYPNDEVLALTVAAGFEVVRQRCDRMVYMQSPACTRGRVETVFTTLARRGPLPVSTAAAELATPDWQRDTTRPVPRFDGLDAYVPPHPFFAAVIALVDGQRSVEAIAHQLVSTRGLPAHAAAPGVLACLREVWSATLRRAPA